MALKNAKAVLSVALCACLLSGCGEASSPAQALPPQGGETSVSSAADSVRTDDSAAAQGNSSDVDAISNPPAADSGGEASQSAGAQPTDANPEPPLSEADRQTPAPDFLTEEQQLLYRRAYKMMLIRVGTYVIDSTDFFPYDAPDTSLTDEDSVVLDGFSYAPALHRYQSWDLFYDTLKSIFTEEFLQESYICSDGYTYFRPVDGRMYYLPAERGYSSGYALDTTKMEFALLKRGPDQIDIQVTATYATDETGSQAFRQAWLEGLVSNTKTYTITLQRERNGWRFSQFDVPF